jgi:hypothetical protein
MYSLLLLVCVNTTGDCFSVAPEMIFSSRQECQQGFYVVLDTLDSNPSIDLIDAQCVSWDKRS